MRFRLSTVLLSVALMAVVLAWYVDQRSHANARINGTWYFPTAGSGLSGYWETLTIRDDGTFEKLEKGRMGSSTYSGTWLLSKHGMVTFHVTHKTFIGLSVQELSVDARFHCRYVVDYGQKNLALVETSRNIVPSVQSVTVQGNVRVEWPKDCDGIRWHCYSTTNHDDRIRNEFAELLENVQKGK